MCSALRYRQGLQYRLLIPALNAWAAGQNTRPHAGLPPNFPWYGRIYDVTPDPSFDLQATCTCFIDVFGLLLDMLFMGVCTTSHWQTSGRMVQELNICTVPCGIHGRDDPYDFYVH